jgi:hypothetical protein
MANCGYTSIVYNNPNKILGLQPYYYRARNCNTNLNGNTPADQYQKQKLIQNTVRVYAALYTANLGPLTAYTPPISNPETGHYGVCWNQMSDRPVPSVQPTSVPTGFHNSLNNRHHSVTSSKPGSQTPGGKGCDIKHNSYDRYLNRLKGKGPMRRGVVPPNYGAPIPFNNAFPVYGGKTIKTNIVTTCGCPIGTPNQNLQQNIRIYDNPFYQPYPDGDCSFKVGDYVYAIQTGNTFYTKAVITDIYNGVYVIQFDNGVVQLVNNVNNLKIYFPCNCNSEGGAIALGTGYLGVNSPDAENCTFLTSQLLGNQPAL